MNKLLDSYIEAKRDWQKSAGQPWRINLKRKYQEIKKKLYNEIPDEHHYQGLVFKKGSNNFGKYIAIYTEASFERSQGKSKVPPVST